MFVLSGLLFLVPFLDVFIVRLVLFISSIWARCAVTFWPLLVPLEGWPAESANRKDAQYHLLPYVAP